MRAAVLTAVIVSLFTAYPAIADSDRAYPVKVLYKFSRGIKNVVLSPTELYINTYKEGQVAAADQSNNWADISVGGCVGFFEGIGYMVTRIGVGVFDIVSFPVPTRPLMHPKTPNVFLEDEMER